MTSDGSKSGQLLQLHTTAARQDGEALQEPGCERSETEDPLSSQRRGEIGLAGARRSRKRQLCFRDPTGEEAVGGGLRSRFQRETLEDARRQMEYEQRRIQRARTDAYWRRRRNKR